MEQAQRGNTSARRMLDSFPHRRTCPPAEINVPGWTFGEVDIGTESARERADGWILKTETTGRPVRRRDARSMKLDAFEVW